MGAKGGNRIVLRTVLLLLLIVAAGNTIYVFRYAPLRQQADRAEEALAKPIFKDDQLETTALQEPYAAPVRDWKFYPRSTWHSELVSKREDDGSYSFHVTSAGGRQGDRTIKSFEAWIRKAGETSEKKVDLKRDADGKIITKIDFPTTGEWIMRIRLARESETLEFTERVDVK